MTAPHVHTTDEAKADIRRISHNKGAGDNMGPVSIGGGSAGVATTTTKDVEPTGGEYGDVVNKRPV
jgi:hypothetical protein